jgi:hypothetical protein
MAGFISSWRWAGAIFAALLIAVVALGPSSIAMACEAESAAAASVEGPAAVLASADQADEGQCDDGCGSCSQCSCHHAGASPLATVSVLPRPAACPAPHRLTETPAPTSDLTFGLQRPPRA